MGKIDLTNKVVNTFKVNENNKYTIEDLTTDIDVIKRKYLYESSEFEHTVFFEDSPFDKKEIVNNETDLDNQAKEDITEEVEEIEKNETLLENNKENEDNKKYEPAEDIEPNENNSDIHKVKSKENSSEYIKSLLAKDFLSELPHKSEMKDYKLLVKKFYDNPQRQYEYEEIYYTLLYVFKLNKETSENKKEKILKLAAKDAKKISAYYEKEAEKNLKKAEKKSKTKTTKHKAKKNNHNKETSNELDLSLLSEKEKLMFEANDIINTDGFYDIEKPLDQQLNNVAQNNNNLKKKIVLVCGVIIVFVAATFFYIKYLI